MDNRIVRMSQEVPDNDLRQAERQFEDAKAFYEEIWMDVNELEKRKKEIKRKFAARVDCGLTHDLRRYTSCFGGVDREQLEKLMKEDMEKWGRELDEAEKMRHAHQK